MIGNYVHFTSILMAMTLKEYSYDVLKSVCQTYTETGIDNEKGAIQKD